MSRARYRRADDDAWERLKERPTPRAMSRMARARRWLSLHLTGNRQRYRNWLNRRALLRGKSPLPERLTRPVRSSLPVYRQRVNPATGRPRRDDREIGRVTDRELARLAPQHQRDASRGRPR